MIYFYQANFNGRLVGAIGISYAHTVNLWAKNKGEARLKLYNTHDHIKYLSLTPLLSVGTLTERTLKAEDIYPVFRAALKILDTKKEYTDYPEITDPNRYESDGVNDFDVPGMIANLDALAPEGYYFGSHPDDGADFGFWEVDECQYSKY